MTWACSKIDRADGATGAPERLSFIVRSSTYHRRGSTVPKTVKEMLGSVDTWKMLGAVGLLLLTAAGFGWRTPATQFAELRTQYEHLNNRLTSLERLVRLTETSVRLQCANLPQPEWVKWNLPCQQLMSPPYRFEP
jgi:hypothetical protein